MKPDDLRLMAAFLDDLTALTEKHGLRISADSTYSSLRLEYVGDRYLPDAVSRFCWEDDHYELEAY